VYFSSHAKMTAGIIPLTPPPSILRTHFTVCVLLQSESTDCR
jgi:hypothetical protein